MHFPLEVSFTYNVQGGHFAALEQPKVLKKDVEDFVAQVWSGAVA